jgi:hypothetical protein
VIAWLAPSHAQAIVVQVGQFPPRVIALPDRPVEVAVSGNGALVTALVATAPDAYALIPIDVSSGHAGPAVSVGNFASASANLWSNPPRVVSGATADPPALWFVPGRARVWVYNNVRHVGVQLRQAAAGPAATVINRLSVPASIGIGDLSDLQTSTPTGRVAVLINPTSTPPTYQVWTLSGSGWTTTGAAPLQLCISQTSCTLSISPNGSDLAVSSLSALQLIHLTSPAGSSSGIVPDPIGAPAGSALVMSPSGRTAVSWTADGAVLVDTASRSVRRLPIPLSPGERFDAIGSSPSGGSYVAVIGQGTGCPCRVVVFDATTGAVVGGARLGATTLEVADERPVAVALDDRESLVAVAFDDNPKAWSGVHHRALVTYDANGGRPLQVRANRSLGIGQDFASAPAFRPGSEDVGIVATAGASQRVGGVLMDARTGAIAHRLSLQAGVVTLADNSYGNRPTALRFSPDGGRLAWNAGGSVVVWEIAGSSNGAAVSSNVVLTSATTFDPTALAIADNGQVATVGFSYYPDSRNGGNVVVLTGDELGRFLQPVGIARSIPPTVAPTEGQMSVAMPAAGQIAAVALDFNGSRFFTDTYGATPATLLAQLCASSSRAITPEEWQTYFPGEPYTPACTYPEPSALALNATPPTSPSAVASSAVAAVASPVRARTASPTATTQAYRKRYIGIVSKSLAVVTRPTYSQVKSSPHSSVHRAAKASVT